MAKELTADKYVTPAAPAPAADVFDIQKTPASLGLHEEGASGATAANTIGATAAGASPISIKCTISHDYAVDDVTVNATVKVFRLPLGSKAAPDAVGDIVFNDGTAEPYVDGMMLTDEQKAGAIALIFDDTNMLGVGLKHGSGLLWCTSSARGINRITEIECVIFYRSGAYTFGADKDGSDNLEQIAASLGSPNDTADETKYPAFYFAKNYKVSAANLAETDYATGWYLPSVAELYWIYANGKGAGRQFDIDAAIGALGGDTFGSQCFWSSSQLEDDDHPLDDKYARTVKFSDGVTSCIYKDNSGGTSVSTCAIRKFN
jgi:hypothetical protein